MAAYKAENDRAKQNGRVEKLKTRYDMAQQGIRKKDKAGKAELGKV